MKLKGFFLVKGLFLIFVCGTLCSSLALAEITAATASATLPVRKNSGRTVAVINNEPIFSDELEREAAPFIERMQQSAPSKEQSPEKIAQIKKEILNRLIEERLILQASKNMKMKVSKAELERGVDQFKEPFTVDPSGKPRPKEEAEKAFQEQLVKEGMTNEQFNKHVEDHLVKMKLIDQEVRSKLTTPKDEDGKKLLEKIKSKMNGETLDVSKEENNDLEQMAKYLKRVGGEQVHIRHILARIPAGSTPNDKINIRKKLDDLSARIKKGEDFSVLAKKYSEDPISAERGGDLNFVAKGDLGLPPLEDFVFKAKEGDISPVMESEVGFHLVKVVEKKASHTVEYDEVGEDLKSYLAQKNFSQKLDAYLKDLRSKANIVINE